MYYINCTKLEGDKSMRKLITLLFSVALCFGFITMAEASVDSVYEVAVVDLKGDVQVDTDGSGNWSSPWIGMKLRKDAILKTGSGSYVDVVFDADGLNTLRIKEDTQTTINIASVKLAKGSVLAAFANIADGSSFKVNTPTATCGIRGSGMGVSYINNMTVVSAFEHSVYVQGVDSNGNPVGKEVVIPENWKTQVLTNGNVNPPAELTANEKMIFDAWVAAVTGGDTGFGDDDGLDDDEDSDNKDLEEKKEDLEDQTEISSHS